MCILGRHISGAVLNLAPTLTHTLTYKILNTPTNRLPKEKKNEFYLSLINRHQRQSPSTSSIC